ncbi:alpha/beta hydrolase [Sinimarinibacterium sp. NLF-5-8]|uniref:alpha/beta hydrolase n=1 Tax=Sinimarinibacterium sp. NLF-5-8 TaxID=2698684 RepID=UPI00137C32B4|nr:alpha/beta hydrolase [Sinimarinibacterium sp. NLF-5-8]QHS10328.1 alpha/beta hydrolase [Sinimarinibacterium sp. NLF-5-8]
MSKNALSVMPNAKLGAYGHDIPVRDVHISRRTRWFIDYVLQPFVKPTMRLMKSATFHRVLREQTRTAGFIKEDLRGLTKDYRILGHVPTPTLGDVDDTRKIAVLYLHGGAFVLPAAPHIHLTFVARLCHDLDAVGFVPDYRLAPFHRHPSALDDCESAYRALLDKGFDPKKIILAGESAGGNLVLSLLLRIKRLGLPQPLCAIPISPVTEMARVHAPPSRVLNRKRDPLLPLDMMGHMLQMYTKGIKDATDPELSPIYGDYKGVCPLFFLVGESEILLDDTLIVARQCRDAGVSTRVDIWPHMPHAFTLFRGMLPEAKIARQDIVEYVQGQLARLQVVKRVA